MPALERSRHESHMTPAHPCPALWARLHSPADPWVIAGQMFQDRVRAGPLKAHLHSICLLAEGEPHASIAVQQA